MPTQAGQKNEIFYKWPNYSINYKKNQKGRGIALPMKTSYAIHEK